MKQRDFVIASMYHLFFALCGIGGIALVFYRLWDRRTAAHPELDVQGMYPTIATAALMVGFSVYGLLFRKRVYPKYLRREIGNISASENLVFGLLWITLGLFISQPTDYLAWGAISWGVLQAIHGLLQFAFRTGRRDCGRTDPA